MSHVTHHTSHVTRHTSHVTCCAKFRREAFHPGTCAVCYKNTVRTGRDVHGRCKARAKFLHGRRAVASIQLRENKKKKKKKEKEEEEEEEEEEEKEE
jgi:hypothetical protein